MKRLSVFPPIPWILFLAFLVPVSGVRAAAQSADPVASLLLKMGTADLENSYRGEKVVLDLSASSPKVFRFVIVHSPPNLENRKFEEEASGREGELLSDGHFLWQYFPKRRLVIRRPLPRLEDTKEAARRTLALVLKNYAVQPPEPGPRIAGRASVLLNFIPRSGPLRPRRKIWLDRERGIPLRTEVFGLKDRLRLVSYFESIHFDPVLGPAEFILKVPRGTVVRAMDEVPVHTLGQLDSLMGVKVQVPHDIPQGFSLINLHMALRRGDKVAHLQYTDGLSFLSLFESTGKRYHRKPRLLESPRLVNLGGKTGTLYDLGLLRIIRWEAGGIRLAVVGELDEGELIRFAHSVGPQVP